MGRVIVIGGLVFGLVGPALAAKWEVPARHFSDPTWEEAKSGPVEMPSAEGPPLRLFCRNFVPRGEPPRAKTPGLKVCFWQDRPIIAIPYHYNIHEYGTGWQYESVWYDEGALPDLSKRCGLNPPKPTGRWQLGPPQCGFEVQVW